VEEKEGGGGGRNGKWDYEGKRLRRDPGYEGGGGKEGKEQRFWIVDWTEEAVSSQPTGGDNGAGKERGERGEGGRLNDGWKLLFERGGFSPLGGRGEGRKRRSYFWKEGLLK